MRGTGSWCKGLGAALLVALFAPAVATALPCDPTGADQTDIADARAAVDAACACDGFDRHGEFVRCAKAIVNARADTDQLNPRCKGHVKRIYAKSTCSYPTVRANGSPIEPKICCVISRDGLVVSKPIAAGRCGTTPGGLVQKVACPGFDICLDAADSNGDGLVDASDTGLCSGPVCGDGVVNGVGEECDDGIVGNSDTEPDACRTSCLNPSCGDSVTDTGETCDEGAGNSDAPDAASGCRTDCTALRCGDTIIDTGEECDNGVANSDTTPDACRTDCSNPSCGDGVVDTPEACEVGNDPACIAPSACAADCTCSTCGDNVADAPAEQCDGTDDAACAGLCSSVCSCPEQFAAPLVPGTNTAGSFNQSKGLFGPGAGAPPINLSGTMLFADGGDLGVSLLQGFAPLVSQLNPVPFFGNTVCTFFVSVDPGDCPDPGTCNDVGSCPNNGTCTDLGACELGSCPDPGFCNDLGTCNLDTCSDFGNCNNSSTCDTSGVCSIGLVCVGGPNNGAACASEADCDACVGGVNPGASCSVNSDCYFCVNGAEPGSACPSGLHADCDDACNGGAFDGTACTLDSQCYSCSGGANAGGACPLTTECTDACNGGPNAGNVCTTHAECADVCVGGNDAGSPCNGPSDCDSVCVGGVDAGLVGCVVPPAVGTVCGHACEGGQLTPGSCGQEGGTADDTLCGDTCVGGFDAGNPCTSPTDTCTDACGAGVNAGAACADDSACADFCVGGPANGAPCNDDSACPDNPTAGGGWVDCAGEGLMLADARGAALAASSLPVDDDYLLYQDHCTAGGGPACGFPFAVGVGFDCCDSGGQPFPAPAVCPTVLGPLPGAIDPATGLCVPDGATDAGCGSGTPDAQLAGHALAGNPAPTPFTCNGPTVGPIPTGPSLVGSSAMVINTAIDIRGVAGDPCAPPTLTPPTFQPYVTGTAVAGVMDAFGVPAGIVPCGATCDTGLLSSAVSGALFTCPNVLQGDMGGGKIVTNLPVLDTLAVGPPVDLNFSTRLEFQ